MVAVVVSGGVRGEGQMHDDGGSSPAPSVSVEFDKKSRYHCL